ncbi:uncharacterized protein LOC119768744 [Culex quinquefasciatus]|uniref:uncharacterized protein LOC119768744 n=1 Tax=Culex quinquefasciatus TaxID=7176 RepID=UPI0018E3C6A9|nr:uncharacterized protein LOC119768744 [Culex quinquefasciatus]
MMPNMLETQHPTSHPAMQQHHLEKSQQRGEKWFLHRSSAKLSVVETRLDAYLFGGRIPGITNQPTFTIPVNFPPAFNMVAAVELQPAAGSGGSAKSSGVESAPLSSTAAAGSESLSAAAQKLQNYQQNQKKMQHHRVRLNRSGEYEAYAIVPLL